MILLLNYCYGIDMCTCYSMGLNLWQYGMDVGLLQYGSEFVSIRSVSEYSICDGCYLRTADRRCGLDEAMWREIINPVGG